MDSMTNTKVCERIISEWKTFLSESLKTREKIVSELEKRLKEIDQSVKEQRGVTMVSLVKTLNLKEGDEVIFQDDGSFRIQIKGDKDGESRR